MNPSTTGHSLAKAAAEVSPPVSLTAWSFITDQPINNWLTVLAIVYTALQIVVLVRKEFLRRREAA